VRGFSRVSSLAEVKREPTQRIIFQIDAYPDRHDMSINLIELARKARCQVSIGTDSHGPSQMECISRN
jgi:histidinol phosphatase-like PHP family hydrolase